MKFTTRTIVLSVLGLILVIGFFMGCSAQRNMVAKEEAVITQWAQVENVYQRRADLIPNIVAVVKKYSEFEAKTLENIVNARAKATSININPENLDEASLQKFENAQNTLSASLGRLLMVTENYPDLKSSTKFDALMTELEGCENRITFQRQVFNEKVQDYNTYIRRFPNNMFAGFFGFERKAVFKMKQGSDTTPDVEKLME
ncbi:MAG TPA: LemA family protein [Flavobacteriales bacterium]|nr:LemA family protein [Flavobacteriales bacterium]